MMHRAHGTQISVALTTLLILAAVSSACGSSATEPVPSLTLGATPILLPATVWIAVEQGFFAEEGIDVRIEEYVSGRAALTALSADEGPEMVTVAQTPIVFDSFERQDFAILATMVTSFDDEHVIARRDREILTPADLRGTRVGVTLGTAGHFFLALFLADAGLTLSDVEVVHMAPDALPIALAAGDLDAISTWEPHLSRASEALGETAIVFDDGDFYREDFYFVATKDWLGSHDDTVQRFLQALIRAEDFIQSNPEESKTLVARRIGMSRTLVDTLWSKFAFAISLDQSLLNTLELQARWVLEAGFVEADSIPNYLEFVWAGPLEQVRPAAVRFVTSPVPEPER